MTALLIVCGFQTLSAARVGYAFSGGGARGYAQLGILKVLEEQGVYPDYISGVSMGAIVGGLYAMGYSAAQTEELLLNMDFQSLIRGSFSREDIYIGQKRWPTFGNVTLLMNEDWKPNITQGFYEGNMLNLEMARLFMPASAENDFSLLPIKYCSLSTDLVNGQTVVFTQGSLMQSVRASISIPSIMAPFEFNGHTYVDGGLLQNMPIPQVIELGADVVVGLKVNSKLRTPERLSNMVEILDQTINIGMTQNINEHLGDCDLLLEPDLGSFTSLSYPNAAELLSIGEAYARANIERIIAFRDSLLALGHVFRRPQPLPDVAQYKVNRIECRGNAYISAPKIREYADLAPNRSYTSDQIISACKDIWNSQLFYAVYPVLEPVGNGYDLVIYVKERERRHLTLNLTYTTEEELNVEALFSLNNLALRNSRLLAGLTLGGRTELNIDYVKNFGDLWGAYFRLFPYLSEHRLYLYDDEYYKVSSVKTLEYGITPGVGIFANKLAIAEGFLYSYQTRLYRDVSATAPISTNYTISGAGLKLYHESLDDDVYPQSGLRFFAKSNFARWTQVSDQIYSRVMLDIDLYSRIHDIFSLRMGLDYGTYFGAEQVSSFDPFYFSGANGYKGYQSYAVSSPQYKYYTLGLCFNPMKSLYLEGGVQGLNIAEGDTWGPDQDIEWCLYGDLCLRTIVGPIRVSAAIRDNSRPNYYLSIGFDKDIFWFSRK